MCFLFAVINSRPCVAVVSHLLRLKTLLRSWKCLILAIITNQIFLNDFCYKLSLSGAIFSTLSHFQQNAVVLFLRPELSVYYTVIH